MLGFDSRALIHVQSCIYTKDLYMLNRHMSSEKNTKSLRLEHFWSLQFQCVQLCALRICCMCAYCVCVCVGALNCVYTCGDHRLTLGIFWNVMFETDLPVSD